MNDVETLRCHHAQTFSICFLDTSHSWWVNFWENNRLRICVEGCSEVGLGLYLTRSTLRIQNSQLPVGCMSTCGFAGWTWKVTLFRRPMSIYWIQGLALLDMSKPCCSRLSRVRSAVGRKRSGSSFRASKSWIHSRSQLIQPNQRHIHSVEVKYCKDTKPRSQLNAAKQQHSALYQHLRRAAANASLHTIPHGASKEPWSWSSWSHQACYEIWWFFGSTWRYQANLHIEGGMMEPSKNLFQAHTALASLC